ncbi:glycosyltransferase family 39 protein [Bacteroides sp. 51]|uniref:ArnT family glycosyltransferase n=1 Tax=Bacteroides sp. 51 TaxID=2302938 RepID=UPI0013D5E583|nr:glycosyltransferase family 39 protein [Bacteroides sp. 51]NDV83304.1 phospholipid carrier-dependent glycosyltransferase [Bacteroides sp. 51]
MYNRERILDKPYIHYVVIVVVCCFAFFINNQVIPADLMESRNLATAQEMVRTGNYLIPTMNGELRLEKPPLPTWIAAGIEHIAPGSLIVQRYASGIMATLMVVFLYLLVVEMTRNKKAALFSGLALATCFNVILMGRTATWDIYCHSFMLMAIYYLVLALKKEGAQWKNFLAAGIFMGLSFLSKGPVSFYALLLSFIIAYGFTFRPSLKKKVAPLITMILLCLVISFWWNVYLLLSHPEMMLYVAHKESSSWINYNVRPWYYYWKFAAEAGIWALFLITAIVSRQRSTTFKNSWRGSGDMYVFALTWFLSSLVLLSVIPEKKTRYLLPILIPGAILIGLYFYHSLSNLNKRIDKVIFKINATLVAIILLAIPVVLYVMFYRKGEMGLMLLILSAVLSWALCIYILRSTYAKAIRVESVFWGIVLSMMMIEAVCLDPIGDIFINADRNSIRLLRENDKVRGLPFFYNQDEKLRMELVYEVNQTLKPMDVTNDSLISANSPFVFVSGKPAEQLFAGKNVVIENIGEFDNNWRKTGSKRYNWDLVRNVVIVKKNQPSTVNDR